MGIVKIKDKTFKTSIPEADILKKVQVVADRLNQDYADKTPVFLAVLNGSFIFAADLMRMITVPSEISFVKYASYEGTSSTGSMKTLMGLNQDLTGRHVVIVEVQVVADRLNQDYADKTPVFLAVLNGSFIFAADLMRMITVPSEISFVKYASYEGTSSTGSMKTLMGLNQELTGRHVVIVEDIVDSGFTMAHMIEDLKKKNPASIEICSLLVKPGNLKVDLDINYAVMEIPNDFIVGYGLDYDQEGRNLRDIYTIVEE